MRYYAELLNGDRKPISEMVYHVLINEGWYHVLREEVTTIITMGKYANTQGKEKA